jgi:hypothetical protein
MKSIDQQYSEIENAIFTKTKEKVDPYTRGGSHYKWTEN